MKNQLTKIVLILTTCLSFISCKSYDNNRKYKTCMKEENDLDPVWRGAQERLSGLSPEKLCKERADQCNKKYGSELQCNDSVRDECYQRCDLNNFDINTCGLDSLTCDMSCAGINGWQCHQACRASEQKCIDSFQSNKLKILSACKAECVK